MKRLFTLAPLFLLMFITLAFFKPFILEGKLPIPADTIVGLYHPFRDLYAKEYPNGIPFKNPLITDPVRQQYPWRELTVTSLKQGELPLWNPYSMTGYQLLGNQQSAPFYPLNLLLFVMPFSLAWSILILLQPLLAGIFLYLYLRSLRIHTYASILGALSFSFSGFFIAWLEWGTILHSALWFPLILLSIDKIASSRKYRVLWGFLFVSSLCLSFLAGHLQTFFYVFLIAFVYMFARWWQHGRNKRTLVIYIIYYVSFIILTSIQWIPTLALIGESARNVDLDWQKEGWFIPWQHLIQFVAPDFFGNPTTLNYWGVWNYGEFVGYVGMLPLLLGLFALFSRRDKKTFFFAGVFLFSLLFAFPTVIAKLPYILNVPFLSTVQPTRLLFLIDFSLAILAAFGLDFFLRQGKKIMYPLAVVGIILAGLWIFVLVGSQATDTLGENASIANRNLRLPTALFVCAIALFTLFARFPKIRRNTLLLSSIIVAVTVFDLIRFGWKFTPFTNGEYLFPSTKVIEFLQKQEGQFRIMNTDSRIFPPNFSTIYRLQSVDGYDPLYLRRYGELIAASERGRPDISPPFGFNRIINPHNYNSKIIDLLGVKYILSLSDLSSPKLKKVFQEGQTRVYENINAQPRAFFVKKIHEIRYSNKQEAIETIMNKDIDLRETAVVEFGMPKSMVVKRAPFPEQSIGKAEIKEYSTNRVVIKTENTGDGFLVFTDTFYPSWRVKVDSTQISIVRTDYNFRGVIVPRGEHVVEFSAQLF